MSHDLYLPMYHCAALLYSSGKEAISHQHVTGLKEPGAKTTKYIEKFIILTAWLLNIDPELKRNNSLHIFSLLLFDLGLPGCFWTKT